MPALSEYRQLPLKLQLKRNAYPYLPPQIFIVDRAATFPNAESDQPNLAGCDKFDKAKTSNVERRCCRERRDQPHRSSAKAKTAGGAARGRARGRTARSTARPNSWSR